MNTAVQGLTSTELDDWLNKDLPCRRAGMDCLNPGVWQAHLDCGHVGALCEEHHGKAVERLQKMPGWRWFCLDCKRFSDKLEWRRL